MIGDSDQYEIVSGFGEHGAFVELWDRTSAPGGLAFEMRSDAEGRATLTGYDIDVAWDVVRDFLREAESYLGLK